MKTKFKFIFTLLIIIACVSNINLNTFATEEGGKRIDGDCLIDFTLIDKTGGVMVDDITVTMVNIDTTVDVAEYVVNITSADYLFGVPVKQSVKYGNYNIAINFQNKDKFEIKNEDGTDISSFRASSETQNMKWIIVPIESKKETNKTEVKGKSENSEVSQYDINIADAEANRLWNEFLAAVSPLEAGEYSQILKIVSDTAGFNAKYYETITKRSKDEYLNMTDFEKFLWYATYILPVNGITSSDYDTYCGSLTKWNANTVGIPQNWFKTYGTSEMADTYKALMEWDYNFYLKNGGVMNFITGRTSLENEELEVLSSEDGNGNDTDINEEEVENLLKQEEEQGIWSGTAKLIKENVITLIILLILIGATVAVVVYRKRKAIEDDKESK